jgi:hypothetical protein
MIMLARYVLSVVGASKVKLKAWYILFQIVLEKIVVFGRYYSVIISYKDTQFKVIKINVCVKIGKK